jgi:hypothetical protein
MENSGKCFGKLLSLAVYAQTNINDFEKKQRRLVVREN